MKRDLIRVFRRQGYKPLLIPAAVLLLFFAALFQYLGPYVDHRDEAQELDMRIQAMEASLGITKRVEAHQALMRSEYTGIQSRAYRYDQSADALETMKAQVAEILRSLYFENVQVSVSEPPSVGLARRLDVTAEFSGVPQQLPRLESLLAGYPMALRISDLRIKVVEDGKDASPHLEIKARFTGIQLSPDASEKPNSPPLPPVK